MAGEFAVLNLTQQDQDDLMNIFIEYKFGVNLVDQVMHPGVAWTPANQQAITDAFTVGTAIPRANLPRHKYVQFLSGGDLSLPSFDAMAQKMKDKGFNELLKRPDIGLKALNNEAQVYGTKTVQGLWDSNLRCHAMIGATILAEISLEYYQFNGVWV
jgi:hypothetical protein